jgi:hypothetical protein
MQIYIHRNNEQLGPFTEAEVKAKLASGAISPQDHVWWQGQANWIPLGQSSLLTPGFSAPPGIAGAPSAGEGVPTTSKFAIWSLVCGCLSLLCGIFASIPAIILGHMGRSEIKKNPALQGGGMALAGMILGYVFTTLIVIYLISIVVLLSMGNNVKDIFKTINAQIEAAQATNSADQSVTTPDQTTNAPDQTTPAPATTNTSDQSTNSAPAATNSPDQSTNSAPAATNSPDQSTNSAPAATNGPTPSTNAPDSSTNAAPMTQ